MNQTLKAALIGSLLGILCWFIVTLIIGFITGGQNLDHFQIILNVAITFNCVMLTLRKQNLTGNDTLGALTFIFTMLSTVFGVIISNTVLYVYNHHTIDIDAFFVHMQNALPSLYLALMIAAFLGLGGFVFNSMALQKAIQTFSNPKTASEASTMSDSALLKKFSRKTYGGLLIGLFLLIGFQYKAHHTVQLGGACHALNHCATDAPYCISRNSGILNEFFGRGYCSRYCTLDGQDVCGSTTSCKKITTRVRYGTKHKTRYETSEQHFCIPNSATIESTNVSQS